MTKFKEVTERPEDEDWISLTKAGFILEVRYLKARDLASTGKLGEIRRVASSNRYYVQESKVREYKDERESRGIQTSS